MPNDKKENAVDFLNNIDNTDVFKEEEQKEVIEEGDVKEEKEEKPLAFHQDPKVQKFIERRVEKRLKDFKPSVEQQFRKDVDEEINLPSSFIKLVGNDTDEKKEVLRDLSKYFGTLKGEARQEFLQELEQQRVQSEAEDRKAQEELETYFEEIEETYNVDLSSNSALAKKTRSEFIDFVREIAPKNEEGEVAAFPDLVSSFKTFQELNKRSTTSNRAKEHASRGLTRSTDASSAVSTGRSWKDVERHFSKLKE